jgi:hypothetical protein
LDRRPGGAEDDQGLPPMLHDQDTRALETMDHVLAALKSLGECDHSLNTLMNSIEDDRARVHALALGSHLSGRTPPRISTYVADARPAMPPPAA